MIDTLTRGAALCTLLTTLFAFAPPSLAQAPTDAQRSAIRSACRSDYEAHCASVPPGGMASLQCLQQNMSSLSSSCQAAVQAVEPAAASKAESAPAAEPAEESVKQPSKSAAETSAPVPGPVATSTPAKKPSSSQIAAIRSACRADYQRSCASVPTGGAAALKCLERNQSKLSVGCQQAVNAASGGAPATTATVTPGAASGSPPEPALMLRPMRPREELFVLRSACGGDVRALCAGIPFGGGRIVRCLATQAASLSPACKGVLAEFAAR